MVLSRATLDRIPTHLPVESIGPIKISGRAATVEVFRLITG
jgi:hypothetical protein